MILRASPFSSGQSHMACHPAQLLSQNGLRDDLWKAGHESLQAIRSATDQKSFTAQFLAIPRCKVVVTHSHVFYLTADDHFCVDYFPKPWVYQSLLAADGTIEIPIGDLPARHAGGAGFAPFFIITGNNWFHTLCDHFARLYFYPQLGDSALPILVPCWAMPRASRGDEFVAASFFDGKPVHCLQPGIYHYDLVVLPPLANQDDYLCAAPIRFMADTLYDKIGAHPPAHGLRLFVSRADTPVRNLANEAALIQALRPLGFQPVCPGDFSFRAQLELFAAAELIIGVHGLGLMPMICARHCRRLMEFEAAGWEITAYRSLACLAGMAYEKMPCQMVDYRSPARFDWLARADIPASVMRAERAIAALQA